MTPELELLAVWEAASAAPPPARGAALLSAADPSVSLEELLRLPIGELDARVLALRASWFGDSLTGTIHCSHCATRIEVTLGGGPLSSAAPFSTHDLMSVAHLDAAAARRALGEVDFDDTHITTDCPACGGTSDVVIDPGAFLWSEVNAAAARLLRDVHALAAAYGWTEEEVLAIPASRRRLYVAMVSA